MNNELMTELAPVVEKAARVVARKWPDVADADDVQQEIWIRLMESPGSVDKLGEMDDDHRRSALEQIGHKIAAKERDDYEVFSGNVYYGTEDVHGILKKIEASDQSAAKVGFDNGGGIALAVEEDIPGSMTLIERMDVLSGIEELTRTNVEYSRILFSQYWLKEPIHTYRVELSRAVDRLTVLMNRVNNNRRYSYSEGPGSRRVVSNQQARKQSDNQYEGWK